MKPIDNQLAYTTIVLGSVRSPGVVTLTGHDRFKNWNIKKARGQIGATTTLEGDDVVQFQASFYIADDGLDAEVDEFQRWGEFRRVIESTVNGARPIALPIFHPELVVQGIIQVVSGGIGGGRLDGRGGVTYDVKFLEYNPPRPKRVSNPQAKGGTKGEREKQKPDPNAAAKRELNNLVNVARLL